MVDVLTLNSRFPPKARDDLVKALGDKIKVQESDWNCVPLATPNHEVKPFDDPRVRKALTPNERCQDQNTYQISRSLRRQEVLFSVASNGNADV